MILLRRITPLVSALAVAAGLEVGLTSPHSFPYTASAALILFLVLLAFVVDRRLAGLEHFTVTVTPAALLMSGAGYLLFLEGAWPQQVVVAVVTLFGGLYLQHVYLFLYEPGRYRPWSLERLVVYLNIVSCFFTAVALFSANMFLTFPGWVVAPLLGVLSALLVGQTLLVNKVRWTAALPYVVVAALVAAEVSWIVLFLPAIPLVLAFFVTVVYYLFTNLARHHLTTGITPTLARYYVFVGLSVVTLVAVTAQWYY